MVGPCAAASRSSTDATIWPAVQLVLGDQENLFADLGRTARTSRLKFGSERYALAVSNTRTPAANESLEQGIGIAAADRSLIEHRDVDARFPQRPGRKPSGRFRFRGGVLRVQAGGHGSRSRPWRGSAPAWRAVRRSVRESSRRGTSRVKVLVRWDRIGSGRCRMIWTMISAAGQRGSCFLAHAARPSMLPSTIVFARASHMARVNVSHWIRFTSARRGQEFRA